MSGERWLRGDWRNLSLPRLRVEAWDDAEIAVGFEVAYHGGDPAFSIGASFTVPGWLWDRVYDWDRRRMQRQRRRFSPSPPSRTGSEG